MIFLDTHVVVWLYTGLVKKLSVKAIEEIESNDLVISQMVRLELQYLYEIERITEKPEVIIKELNHSIGLSLSESTTKEVLDKALECTWTRDVFDRLIVSEAIAKNTKLITKDKTIRANYELAVW